MLQHHVVRLEVAIHHPQPVQVRKRRQDTVDIRDCLRRRQRAPLLPYLLQRLATHILHHDEAFARGLHEVVNAHDIGVLHRRQELPLRHRNRGSRLILRIQKPLQHHIPRQQPVKRQVDPPQPAEGNRPLHLILPRHHVAGLQRRHKAVLRPTLAAKPRFPP